MSRSIYWFTNDLRLTDNPGLVEALAAGGHISFVYCIDPKLFRPGRYQCPSMGAKRHRFLLQSLEDLDSRLRRCGQHLNVYYDNPLRLFEQLHSQWGMERIFHSVSPGFYEVKNVEAIKQHLPQVKVTPLHTHTLFQPENLPFLIKQLPDTFTQFRKQVEKAEITIAEPLETPTSLGKSFIPKSNWRQTLPRISNLGKSLNYKSIYFGGETSGLRHLTDYFQQDYAQEYKQTRNELDQHSASTKFSPWLAHGCISPRQVVHQLKQHEQFRGANESTYWIFFELLWREYFQWYAHKYGNTLFAFGGIKGRNPTTSFYGERYQQWCQGSTPFPIVNACMKQLNATGYMSNRGRQLVASCFVNELQLDWRYGAAYFEQHLLDYDVASNWGNWQYLAGVGADPRGARQFNLQKQTDTYDPDGEFIERWQGNSDCMALDSVDAVGWPL